jgi:zinc protease
MPFASIASHESCIVERMMAEITSARRSLFLYYAALAGLLFALAPPIFRAASLPFTPIRLFYLQNGLRAVMESDQQAPVVDVQVWYHVGSKDERPGMAGFAHLFEHLMFDGTTNVGPQEFSTYIIRSGGKDDAYTTNDATVFWETVPSADLPVALWLEADRMRNLRITQAVFDKEKSVVDEERRHRFDNQPYGNVVAMLYAHAYTVSPYQHMPIGSMQDLQRATLADVQSFYQAYYAPRDATVVIAGRFDEGQAVKWLEQYFGPLQDTGSPIPNAYPSEPPQHSERVVKVSQDVALPAFIEGYHIPDARSQASYPLQLAAKILADGDSSWLYRNLVYREQSAVEVDCAANFMEESGLFMASAVMNPGYSPQQGEAEVNALLDRLKDGKISSEDLTRAKNEMLRDDMLKRESAQGRAGMLGKDAVILGDPDLYNTEPGLVLKVTPAEIQQAAEQYLISSNETVIEVYPKQADR